MCLLELLEDPLLTKLELELDLDFSFSPFLSSLNPVDGAGNDEDDEGLLDELFPLQETREGYLLKF